MAVITAPEPSLLGPAATEPPLVVDLDGTLVATDTLWEGLLALGKTRPWLALCAPLWLFRGKAYLKLQVARHASLPVEALPYREEVVDLLRGEQARGRCLVLATAAAEGLALQVQEHLQLFEVVLATTAGANLRGARKVQAIQACVGSEFDYIGDAQADLPVWRAARKSYVAAPSRRLLSRAAREVRFEQVLGSRPGLVPAALRACRPHQWAKNLLLFAPLVLAPQAWSLGLFGAAALALVCFSLVTSGVYLINDLLDLFADRTHPRKKRRPCASGALPIATALPLAGLLLSTGLLLCLALLPPPVALALLAYQITTFAYSFYLKRLLLVDVVCLAGLYTLRIQAGGCLPGLHVSDWLLAFSVFFFTSLALLKRFNELALTPHRPRPSSGEPGRQAGRAYELGDLDLTRALGVTTGVVAVLVFSLYISSDYVREHFHHSKLLWYIDPVLFYWICRVWFLAQRGQLPDDPVSFALRDRASYAAGAVILLLFLCAR